MNSILCTAWLMKSHDITMEDRHPRNVGFQSSRIRIGEIRWLHVDMNAVLRRNIKDWLAWSHDNWSNVCKRQNSMLVCLHIRGQGQCQILDNYYFYLSILYFWCLLGNNIDKIWYEIFYKILFGERIIFSSSSQPWPNNQHFNAYQYIHIRACFFT